MLFIGEKFQITKRLLPKMIIHDLLDGRMLKWCRQLGTNQFNGFVTN
ncbi:hypothetical protein HMPREF0495_01354 [Levilactobacillus brevis ATCC 14869 = DSM 20054]|uniref:Uncharacterized protein n=1 Tax=Levilactobacillus brevis ATCC 14869 = DSM 20054 TaxID=649758 RepID=U2P092_LEVBR|nr:hypothetical protein HMPREF0495_01354 [Levilactobacillus brevis ATCC 14869 = DSM 20054]